MSRTHPADPPIALSPKVSDEVRHTTCYMCACRCGIRVHLEDGAVRYIEGNPDHPVNRGVLCGKGAAGIMKQNSPAKLQTPLLRSGPRGSGQFRAIGWDEALGIASARLAEIRRSDPRRLAFFTGRDQSQALTGWWATQFGTPNYAAHGGFCSVNMAAAGMYSMGGSFWEFGEPDWAHTRYFMLFGVAEDHGSNPLKIALGELKARGAKFVSVNPVRTGYSAIADEWVGLRPGTDGLFVMALIHELLRTDRVDFAALAAHTNAGWLVMDDPGAADDGLFARDAAGHPVCRDGVTGEVRAATEARATPVMVGRHTLPDGRHARPAFELIARRYLDGAYAPEAVAQRTGVPAADIRRLAAELAAAAFDDELVLEMPWTDWAGRRHARMVGRPVSFHAMRGISAHSNGFHTCRALHLLQMLLGTVDAPGGFLYKPPYPKSAPPPVKPAGPAAAPGATLCGPPLGYPQGPEDLLVDDGGRPLRLDRAYSWEAPLAAHGLMHRVIRGAHDGDPYPVDTLLLYMANMAWISSMNTTDAMAMLTAQAADGSYRIPFIIYCDAFWSEMVAYADLVLPDTTYLERYDAISLLDRPISSAHGPADSIRQPVLKPDRDVRPFQDVLLELGARLGLPGMVDAAGAPTYPGGYADYIVNHQRAPGIGTLAGWREADGSASGRGAPNPAQLDAYVKNGCFWTEDIPPAARYFRHSNRAYLDYAVRMGFLDSAEPVVLQLYCEPLQRFRLAARGHGGRQPPEHLRARIERYFDPLPFWYPPLEETHTDAAAWPLHAITQRPMIMYHAWDAQNAWQRQIINQNRLYLNRATAQRLGLADDDWVWVTSRIGRIRGQVRLMEGVNPDTVWTWNAIAKRAGAWNLDPAAPEACRSFLLNHLIADLLPADGDAQPLGTCDPVTGQAAWYDLRVRVEPAPAPANGRTEPQFAVLEPLPALAPRPQRLELGARFRHLREGSA